MIKDGWAVTHQMLNELDRTPFGPAQQLRQSPFALDQWQAAQIVAVMPDQVEGVQHHLTAPSSVPQRMEVRRPVVAGDHRLAVDQKRGGPELRGGFDNSRKRSVQSWPPRVKHRTREPSRRTINR